MRIDFTHSPVAQLVPLNCELLITRSGITCISDARRLSLRVKRGPIWVTQEGTTDDVVLETGQSLSIPSRRLTLVSPCGAKPVALVRIETDTKIEPRSRARMWGRVSTWRGDFVSASFKSS